MNPCRECVKIYKQTPCSILKHCAFEGTNESPVSKMNLKALIVEQK